MKITDKANQELSIEQKLEAVARAMDANMSDAELDSQLAKVVNSGAPSDAPIDPASQFSCFGCE